MSRRIGAGYPRVVGQGRRFAGTGMHESPEYIAGYIAGNVGAAGAGMAEVPQHLAPQSPPWRPMVAPGIAPVGEGHVPMPMIPESFGGVWGIGATPAGAPAGSVIVFTARPQKPFKATRLIVRGTKSGATAIGNLIGALFVGTDLQQGELGNVDLETLGAGGAFDTWVSFTQAEPGVSIRAQTTLTAFPAAGGDFELYTLTIIGHYLQ